MKILDTRLRKYDESDLKLMAVTLRLLGEFDEAELRVQTLPSGEAVKKLPKSVIFDS